MYLSDLIRKPINELLQNTLVGKRITIDDDMFGEVTFVCKDCRFGDDDGNVWLEFYDSEGKHYETDGQGIDIWFKIEDA